jgi:hypothetical protein
LIKGFCSLKLAEDEEALPPSNYYVRFQILDGCIILHLCCMQESAMMNPSRPRVIRLRPADNVVVALYDLSPGFAVGEKLLDLIRRWQDYAARNGATINNNPSPGNKAGGLTTILEKSLGAATKGGKTNLMAVYDYAEPITAKVFVFMDTPGYDPASAMGMVAGGGYAG